MLSLAQVKQDQILACQGDIHAKLGEAGAGDQPDVARADRGATLGGEVAAVHGVGEAHRPAGARR